VVPNTFLVKEDDAVKLRNEYDLADDDPVVGGELAEVRSCPPAVSEWTPGPSDGRSGDF
jgi:hypothetical protein